MEAYFSAAACPARPPKSLQHMLTAGFRMEKNYLHIWPRHSFMLIALPNLVQPLLLPLLPSSFFILTWCPPVPLPLSNS